MEPDSEISSTCANDTLESLERRKAPEKLYLPTGVLNTAEVRRDAGETLGLTLYVFDHPIYEDDFEYTRTMPGELVERVKNQVWAGENLSPRSRLFIAGVHELLSDILAWHEGKG